MSQITANPQTREFEVAEEGFNQGLVSEFDNLGIPMDTVYERTREGRKVFSIAVTDQQTFNRALEVLKERYPDLKLSLI